MTRYYYDCPLKAAFMAKYHGMRFTNQDGLELDFDGDCFLVRGAKVWGDTLFYIHPDSIHLLEPQVGDIISRNSDGYNYVYWIAEIDKGELYTKHLDCLRQWIGTGVNSKIIQRNNQAFHWPESEEV